MGIPTATITRAATVISGDRSAAPEEPIDSRFWILLSPALPVGGYSYSHGLESAVGAGLIADAAAAQNWIESLGERVLPTLDLPLVLRLLAAFDAADAVAVREWNDVLLATRESAELLEQEAAKGAALQRLLPTLEVHPAFEVEQPGFATVFAQLCSHWSVSPPAALSGYAWVWYEMLVAAAVKLVPLGHTDGQRLLLRFNRQLSTLVQQAIDCSDDNLVAGTPGLAILSSAHETQHARVFRS